MPEKCPEDVIGTVLAKKRGPRKKTVEAISGCDLPASGLSHSVVIWNAVVLHRILSRVDGSKSAFFLYLAGHLRVLQRS